MAQSRSTHVVARPSDVTRDAGGPPQHVLLDVLANRRRRYVLRCLCDSGSPMTIDELAADVAKREAQTPVPEPSPKDVDRVTVSLSHSHVPKLADAGVLEYTRKYDEIGLSVAPRVVEPFLQTPDSSA